METRVKWNLDEATEVMIITDSRVIEFKKAHISGGWVDNSIDPPQRFNNDNLQNLLDGYALAGYVPLVVAPKKEAVLKLGTKMVEVSTEPFDWEDVKTVNVYREGRKAIVFKFEGDEHGDYVEGECVFARVFIDSSGMRTKNSYMWDAQEIEDEMFHSTTEMYEIYNHDGELMQYNE